MASNRYSSTTKLIVAALLAAGLTGIASADDSSIGRFGGDSYAYFNQPVSRTAADPTWRQSHPNGLTDHELQALSSSGLAASAPEFNPPMFASAPADPSWRQSHPNGLTERELQGLSSSNLAVWQAPNGSENTATASIDRSNGAWTPSKETFAARLAKFFQANGAPAGTQW